MFRIIKFKYHAKRPIDSDANMTNFIGRIEYYNMGDDFQSYIEHMQHLLKLNKIEDSVSKISFMIGVGGAELYKVAKTLVAPRKPEEFTFDDLVKLLIAHFLPKKNITAERF